MICHPRIPRRTVPGCVYYRHVTSCHFCASQVLQLPAHSASATGNQRTVADVSGIPVHTPSQSHSAAPARTASTRTPSALHPSCPTHTKQFGHPSSRLPTSCQHRAGDARTIMQSGNGQLECCLSCAGEFTRMNDTGAYISGVELVRTPRDLVGDYRHFQGNFCFHLQGKR